MTDHARRANFLRVAHASRALVSASRRNSLLEKSAKAGRLRQHARRVRYPELSLNTCEGLVGRDSVEPGKLAGPQSVALRLNTREQWDRFPHHMAVRQTTPLGILE